MRSSQWTLILIFCVDVHKGLDPPPPVHLRPPEPDPLPPPCGRNKWMAPNGSNGPEAGVGHLLELVDLVARTSERDRGIYCKGSSIYDVHKKIRFLTPSSLSTCVHMCRTPYP